MKKILGISGSPIQNSNTDRAVKMVLEATGLESEFVKLSDLDISACKACLGCVKTNRCVVKDDMADLAETFYQSAGFVIGAYTPYSSLDARTKAFMERLYCLRHRKGLSVGKPGVAVITSACDPLIEGHPPALELATRQIELWTMEEGMNLIGTVGVTGNVPCIKCGFGDCCNMSGVKMLFGKDATVESVGNQTLEEQESVKTALQRYAAALKAAI